VSPFEAAEGELFEVLPNPQWTAPLGRDLCIVNVDSRPMNHTNQVWAAGKTHFDWSHISGSQSGYLNHYMYSRIHNYRYMYVQATVPDGYVTAWARPGVFQHIFSRSECKVVIYADSDVVIPNLRLPFEWLLNHWEIPINRSMLAVSVEPEGVVGLNLKDKKGKLGNNAGFIIMHNRHGEGVLEEMMRKWGDCLSEVDYPGCAEFKGRRPAE
jgi:hypothetical protein